VQVVGANGAGKTNLLESLHLVTQGFSPRTRSDAQLIRFGRDAARTQVRGARRERALEIRVDLSKTDGKRALMNGARLSAAEQLRWETQTLVFIPERLVVVKGGPAARRAYFDRVLGRLSPARSQLPAEYAAAVGQRNASLRRLAAGYSDHDALAPWTERVVALGGELVTARREVIEGLGAGFRVYADELGLSDARLSYEGEAPSVTELEGRLERDLERGTTGAGPHLHDVTITGGSRDLRTFGSQGEQRLAVLALLLAEAQVLASRWDATPLVLLDDVLSELDSDRRAALVRLLPAGQTVITSTTRDALPGDPAQLLAVTPGRVEQG